jgi:hypothetical protein
MVAQLVSQEKILKCCNWKNQDKGGPGKWEWKENVESTKKPFFFFFLFTNLNQ